MRFLFYSHDAVGLGHVRRHLAIAAALARTTPQSKVLLATSVDEVSQLGLPPNVDTIKLPALRKLANGHYGSRRLALSAAEIRLLRGQILHAAARAFRPSVVLVDKHPLGAGGELQAALEAAKQQGAKIVLGLRDILDAPETMIEEWKSGRILERISELYDLVLVYGDETVYNAVEAYEFPPAIAERTKYCGYVVNDSKCQWNSAHCPYVTLPNLDKRPLVLAAAGGGEDGFGLLKTFMSAAKKASWNGVAIAGPMMDLDQFQVLEQLAPESKVALHHFVPCLADLFKEVDALVCMGGYNTLIEAISTGLPVACVPRSEPRTEQLLRAQRFEKLGLLRTIHPNELTAERLGVEVARILSEPRAERKARARKSLDFDGAIRAANYLKGVFPDPVRDWQRLAQAPIR